MSQSFSAHEVSQSLGELAARVQQGTVQVRGRGPGGGSGVIWSADGLIITNAHVVHSDEVVVELSDHRVFPARLLARDTERDLAALQIDATDLPSLTAGDSDALQVGELVLAVGNPWGVVGAATSGIIHHVPAEGKQRLVQADIVLAPGNSGGPLVNARGEVIGINAMIGGGLGLAVPSNDVVRFLRRQEQRPSLGLSLQPVQLADRAAFVVLEVKADGAASRGGIIVGDVLTGLAGQRFEDPRAFLAALHEHEEQTLVLDILRGGQAQSVTLTLIPVTVAA